MNDVNATVARSATTLEVQATQHPPAASTKGPGLRLVPAVAPSPSRCAREHWSSTLSEDDLENLLQILEADLIPQLLSSYSPGAPRAARSERSSE